MTFKLENSNGILTWHAGVEARAILVTNQGTITR